jgi:hypothetical protein
MPTTALKSINSSLTIIEGVVRAMKVGSLSVKMVLSKYKSSSSALTTSSSSHVSPTRQARVASEH